MRYLNIEVERVTVLLGFGADKVSIHTKNLKCPYPPSVDTSPLAFNFEVTASKGVDYCREELGLNPDEVIHSKYGRLDGPDFLKCLEERRAADKFMYKKE